MLKDANIWSKRLYSKVMSFDFTKNFFWEPRSCIVRLYAAVMPLSSVVNSNQCPACTEEIINKGNITCCKVLLMFFSMYVIYDVSWNIELVLIFFFLKSIYPPRSVQCWSATLPLEPPPQSGPHHLHNE